MPSPPADGSRARFSSARRTSPHHLEFGNTVPEASHRRHRNTSPNVAAKPRADDRKHGKEHTGHTINTSPTRNCSHPHLRRGPQRQQQPSPTPRDSLATAGPASPRNQAAPPGEHRRSSHRTEEAARSLLAKTPSWPSLTAPSSPPGRGFAVLLPDGAAATQPRQHLAADTRQTRRTAGPPAELQPSLPTSGQRRSGRPTPPRTERRAAASPRAPPWRADPGQQQRRRTPPSASAPCPTRQPLSTAVDWRRSPPRPRSRGGKGSARRRRHRAGFARRRPPVAAAGGEVDGGGGGC